MPSEFCRMQAQGFLSGSCRVQNGPELMPACRATLREHDGHSERLITTIHLSRPENYLSIYQSGCNFTCRKCHSWAFSQRCAGSWYAPAQILHMAKQYAQKVTLWEPREKATAWHAQDSCRCCGACVLKGVRAANCPKALEAEAVVLSPQGFGPARNIVAFTGGDVMCCPDFYAACARSIKAHTRLWVLLETNGYGLTGPNLDMLQQAGVDAFWLDIKALNEHTHRWLTGCVNTHILALPEALRHRGFTLEVLSLYIPDLVEADELAGIAGLLQSVDDEIPFTILAFFPEYRMRRFRSPTVVEMVQAYQKVAATGLKNIRLGNLGLFVHSQNDWQLLADHLPARAC